MNNVIKKVQPFDSFNAVCRVLVWAGFYKLLDKQPTRLKRISHEIYRVLALLYTMVYNVQHLIFTVQHRNDMDKLMDCLVIEIPQMNMFAKVFNMLLQRRRIDKIQEVLTGPIFAASDKQEEDILKKNYFEMNRLFKFLIIGVTVCGILWPSSFFVKRYNDKNEVVNSYMPFETDSWPNFALSVFLETGSVLWTGYGHISLDILVASYYAHAQTQLKVIKHQLQYLCTKNEGDRFGINFEYKDYTDEKILEQFKKIVKRYETLVWYKNEIDTAFNFPLTFQFLSTGSVLCLVIFRMTVMTVTSFPFAFLALLFFILLIQVFIYCYYGNLVEFESYSINDSLYKCDWLSLSPSFRQMMLIAMCRWWRPLQPRVCGIITLSLSTFMQIVKSSYTLYTVLVVTAQPTKRVD